MATYHLLSDILWQTITTMAWWTIKPIVAVSAIAVSTLGLLSTKYQKARFYLNLGLYSGTLGIWSIWGVVVSILATAVGQVSYRSSISRSYSLQSSDLTLTLLAGQIRHEDEQG